MPRDALYNARYDSDSRYDAAVYVPEPEKPVTDKPETDAPGEKPVADFWGYDTDTAMHRSALIRPLDSHDAPLAPFERRAHRVIAARLVQECKRAEEMDWKNAPDPLGR
jgi:hypothetical protein